MNDFKPGWQQPPVPGEKPPCSHFGLVFARLTLAVHPVGHEWICTCGKVWRVVSNGAQDKRLVPKP